MPLSHLIPLAVLPALCAMLSTSSAAADAKRPNVIVILADDLGYETLGCNGGTSYKTPVLDRLAAEGVRFDQCYVQPLCTPTRVQLMTSASNARNYINFGNMDPTLKTFGNLFRDAGYATGITGKWQLGQDLDLPNKFGFSDACLWQHTRRPPRYANPGLEINGKEMDYTHGEYGPDIVNDYACQFVAKHKGEPFFLYYPMMLTHGPYEPTPDVPEYNPKAMKEGEGKADKHFGHMVEYMDTLIGKLVKTLDDNGLRENTLVLFVGDNGTGSGTKSMMGSTEVIGAKGSTNMFGMRVPGIASWPGHAAAGKVSGDLIASYDFLPTICEAAKISIPKQMIVDGVSFLPQVLGEAGHPRESIYTWYSPRGEALREFAFNQKYKLYSNGEFYDLTQDPKEKSPLKVSDLTGEAAAAAKQFQAEIAKFANARPAHLPKPNGVAGAAKPAKGEEAGEAEEKGAAKGKGAGKGKGKNKAAADE